MSWESEENNAYSFLNDLNLPNVLFEYFGKSNSTVPDIKVSKNNTFVFYMDIKMGNAQSSQFVVETINNEFKFSSKNKKDSNKYSLQIIDFLNKNFGIFNDVNSAGNQIKCTEDIKVGHIISDFRSKNIRFLSHEGKTVPSK